MLSTEADQLVLQGKRTLLCLKHPPTRQRLRYVTPKIPPLKFDKACQVLLTDDRQTGC